MKRLVPNKNMRKLLARYPNLRSPDRSSCARASPRHGRLHHRFGDQFDWRSIRKVERDLEHLRAGMGYLRQAAPAPVLGQSSVDDRNAEPIACQDVKPFLGDLAQPADETPHSREVYLSVAVRGKRRYSAPRLTHTETDSENAVLTR